MKMPFPNLRTWWMPAQQQSAGRKNLLEVGKGDPIFEDRIKGLRAKFEYKSDIRKYRVVGVTSSIAGEGKTLTCAQLATSLAMTGRHKILLIDADIRKGDLTRGLSLPRHPGLTEYLLGSATLPEILRDTDVPHLQVIASGAVVSSPTDLLSGVAFQTLMKEIRERYDLILLDTPPILPVADTLTIKEQIDGFVFLFRTSHTPVEMVRQALGELGETKVLGAVINGVEPKKQKYIDKYYGYYYHKKPQIVDSSQ